MRAAEPSLSPVPFPVDPSLSPSPAAWPPAPGTELSYLNGTFRLLQKPLRWHDALLLCESRNASLAHVPDPYTQAFLTQAARGLHTPLWIGLASEEVGSQSLFRPRCWAHSPDFPPRLFLTRCLTSPHLPWLVPFLPPSWPFRAQGSRRYSWVTQEPLSYVSWQDGEPQQPGGCAYVDVDGAWRTASCDTKLQGAVCGVNGGECPPLGWGLGKAKMVLGRTPGHFLHSAPPQGPPFPEE